MDRLKFIPIAKPSYVILTAIIIMMLMLMTLNIIMIMQIIIAHYAATIPVAPWLDGHCATLIWTCLMLWSMVARNILIPIDFIVIVWFLRRVDDAGQPQEDRHGPV